MALQEKNLARITYYSIKLQRYFKSNVENSHLKNENQLVRL